MKRLLSGWQDSNLRPPAPKAGAITELRYTPKTDANIVLFLVYININKFYFKIIFFNLLNNVFHFLKSIFASLKY